MILLHYERKKWAANTATQTQRTWVGSPEFRQRQRSTTLRVSFWPLHCGTCTHTKAHASTHGIMRRNKTKLPQNEQWQTIGFNISAKQRAKRRENKHFVLYQLWYRFFFPTSAGILTMLPGFLETSCSPLFQKARGQGRRDTCMKFLTVRVQASSSRPLAVTEDSLTGEYHANVGNYQTSINLKQYLWLVSNSRLKDLWPTWVDWSNGWVTFSLCCCCFETRSGCVDQAGLECMIFYLCLQWQAFTKVSSLGFNSDSTGQNIYLYPVWRHTQQKKLPPSPPLSPLPPFSCPPSPPPVQSIKPSYYICSLQWAPSTIQ